MAELERLSGQELVSVENLGTEQRAALELLAAGKSVSEAARTVGVARSTVYFWLKRDANFSALYSQWREEMKESTQSRMLTVLEKAAGALERGFEAGDAKTALQFLKGMGMIGPVEARETDPVEIRRKQEMEGEKKKVAMKRERAKLMDADLLSEFGI